MKLFGIGVCWDFLGPFPSLFVRPLWIKICYERIPMQSVAIKEQGIAIQEKFSSYDSFFQL